MLSKEDTTRGGFSLIELLVVITIISIILAFSFPMIADMKQSVSASSGANTIAITVVSARRYATDPKHAFALTDVDPRAGTGSSEPGLYSGVAALFTPAGEIRLVWNYESAIYNSGSGYWFLERHGPRVIDTQGAGQPQQELNGFKDLPIDYIQLGSDVGVVGITRNRRVNATKPPLLLAPPFAIWFDQNGYMIATGQDVFGSDRDYQFVYYDGDYNGSYDCFSPRLNNIDPEAYNPNSGRFDRNNWDPNKKKYKLPFEKIEAVIGVFVYSLDAFNNAVEDGEFPAWGAADPTANDLYWAWMRENGQLMMFSRQTGMLMRSRDE
jgi:prepilin-type N-terminal cleavage/methylation domain-containing protein